MSNAYEAERHLFAAPTSLINADRMRRSARVDAEQGSTTILHLHAAYDDCDDHGIDEHEFYGFPEESNDA